MIANLYLHPDAFRHNGKDSRESVRDKLSSLLGDMKDIVYNQHKDNVFKMTNDFVMTPIFENESILDFAQQELDMDETGVLYPMLANEASNFESISYDELLELCKYQEGESEVNSLVILNHQDNNSSDDGTFRAIQKDYIAFDHYKIVYNKNSWIYLRRQILGNHPGEPANFINECRKYFSNLEFHDNCVISLVDNDWEYLNVIPRRIVYYLSCLNDKFEEVRKTNESLGSNPNVILSNFSGIFGLDRPGSLQQNPDKKKYITFEFERKRDGMKFSVLCEPHLKIDKVDDNRKCDNLNKKHFNPRIYFCYTSTEVANGKILVGSIGKHI